MFTAKSSDKMMRTSVIASLCLCALASASLRGSNDKGRSLGVSIELPGISINVPSSGSPSISIGGNGTSDGTPLISIGNNSISIGGQTIDWGSNSTSNMTCDNLPSTSLTAEPSCDTALVTYYESTTDAKFTKARAADQKQVLDNFCDTRCGQIFTARTVATRLGCSARAENDSDVASGVITPQSIALGEGVVIDIPDIFNISTTSRRKRKDGERRLKLDEDLEPEFSPEFPGLWLGCIKDSETNEYCALKRADPDEESCDFYKSCCYAELNGITEISLKQAAQIEAKCPGSTIFRLGRMCTA